MPDARDPRTDGRRLGRAALWAAAAWSMPAAALAVVDVAAARTVFLVGVLAGGALGLLWWTLAGVFGATAIECGCGWTGLVLWESGTLGLFLGALFPALAHVAPLGGFMLAVGAFLALDHFGSQLWRSGVWKARAFWHVLPFVTVAAIQLPLGSLLLALSFRPDAVVGVREIGLALLTMGFAVPAALVAWGVARNGRRIAST